MNLVEGNAYTIKASRDARNFYLETIGKPVTFKRILNNNLARVVDTNGRMWLVRPSDIIYLDDGNNADYTSLLLREPL